MYEYRGGRDVKKSSASFVFYLTWMIIVFLVILFFLIISLTVLPLKNPLLTPKESLPSLIAILTAMGAAILYIQNSDLHERKGLADNKRRILETLRENHIKLLQLYCRKCYNSHNPVEVEKIHEEASEVISCLLLNCAPDDFIYPDIFNILNEMFEIEPIRFKKILSTARVFKAGVNGCELDKILIDKILNKIEKMNSFTDQQRLFILFCCISQACFKYIGDRIVEDTKGIGIFTPIWKGKFIYDNFVTSLRTRYLKNLDYYLTIYLQEGGDDKEHP